nr:MAG TPA: hypothetical protein [Caudoviricetes sp.]
MPLICPLFQIHKKARIILVFYRSQITTLNEKTAHLNG